MYFKNIITITILFLFYYNYTTAAPIRLSDDIEAIKQYVFQGNNEGAPKIELKEFPKIQQKIVQYETPRRIGQPIRTMLYTDNPEKQQIADCALRHPDNKNYTCEQFFDEQS
ncbi:uncharacterized protein LOC126832795 [Adelges cooleyi]|uniref:uncharacterized protein LOC126832795 n=1 Tax=Adelges cooleyi TaxID=133065 RepID=UPI00218090D1|nr:uncharacterized protein LOC126832795 [Adelges cooleyi]XP_050419706.1 uncharacterized protein LOC126832795 [Adelges cooleyi]